MVGIIAHAAGSIAASSGTPLPTLARTITLGINAFNNIVGYGASAAGGSVSDDSFGSDTVVLLQQNIGSAFVLRVNNSSLLQTAFTVLTIDTVHLGRINLLAADASFTSGSGVASWGWTPPGSDYYRVADAGQVLGWEIDGS